MGRYPQSVRSARLKCIDCNAPVVETVENEYVCVACGETPIEPATDADGSIQASTVGESRSAAA